MIVLFVLLICAGIAIFVLYKKYSNQLLTIQMREKEISNLKEEIVSTKNKLAAEYQTALESKTTEFQSELDSKTTEFQSELDSKISELKKKHAKELEAVQRRIEARREELSQKNEKDLLVDVALGLGVLSKGQETISKGQETISRSLISSQEEVKSIKENLFNIGDSVLHDISNGHAETIAKLGVHGDITVASILADILEIMSKK